MIEKTGVFGLQILVREMKRTKLSGQIVKNWQMAPWSKKSVYKVPFLGWGFRGLVLQFIRAWANLKTRPAAM